MENQYHFKRLSESNIPQVVALENLLFPTPWTKNMLHQELLKDFAFFYTLENVDNKVIGYGCFWKVLDEGHITNIAVHPEYQGQGISKIIMNFLIDKALQNQVFILYLEVRRSNFKAIGLYKHYGFQIISERKNYYQDQNEDALIMKLELDRCCEGQY